jgi:hypothetical protein
MAGTQACRSVRRRLLHTDPPTETANSPSSLPAPTPAASAPPPQTLAHPNPPSHTWVAGPAKTPAQNPTTPPCPPRADPGSPVGERPRNQTYRHVGAPKLIPGPAHSPAPRARPTRRRYGKRQILSIAKNEAVGDNHNKTKEIINKNKWHFSSTQKRRIKQATKSPASNRPGFHV